MEDPDPVTNSKTDSTSKIDLVTVLHSQPNPKNNSQDKSSTSTSKEKNSNTVLSPPLNSSWSQSSTTSNSSTSGWSKSFTTSKSSTSGWERYVTKMNNTTSSSSPNKDKCWVKNTELKQSILHKSVHHNSPTEHNHQKSVTFEFSRRNLISNTNQARHSSHSSNQQASNYSQQNNNKVKKNTTTHSISMNKHNMPDTERKALELSKLFLESLESPNMYPNKYTNFNHGASNYWYNYDPPRETVKRFSPDMKQFPFVEHPHMCNEYLKTFLSEDKIKNSSNYMLPSYENYDKKIAFYNHQTVMSSPLTFKQSMSYIKVAFKSFSILMKEHYFDSEIATIKKSMSQNIKRCAEYIRFHGTTKKRIPFDSEISHFLHRCLSLTKEQFPIPSDYDTLCIRIHDACTCLYFGINLKRNMAPGTGKNKPWTRSLNVEEKEGLQDPSLHLPIVPPQKRKPTESSRTVLQSSGSPTIKSSSMSDNAHAKESTVIQHSEQHESSSPIKNCLQNNISGILKSTQKNCKQSTIRTSQ